MLAEEAFEQALAHHRSGRLDEAAECLRQTSALQPVHGGAPGAWLELGCAYYARGRRAQSRACFERALELRPDFPAALSNLALLLQEAGEIDPAIAALRRALELEPGNADRLNGLGGMLQSRSRLDEAMSCYRRALDCRPQYPEAASNLGAALQMLGEFDEAEQWLRRALEWRPEDPQSLYNLGNLRQYQGLLDEAIGLFERALRAQPDFGDAHQARALSLLLKGDYARGWPAYEARHTERLTRPAVDLPEFAFPMWRGEAPAGKRLLLVGEQGYGDQIQFVRYAPLLAQQGVQVDLLVVPPLLRLCQSVAGVRRVVNAVAYDSTEYDYWALLLSMPLRMGTVLDSVPAQVPYLHAPQDAVAKWRARLATECGSRLKVGLVWSGRRAYALDRFRSMPFETLAPLAGVPGICLISLQIHDHSAEDLAPAGAFPGLDLGGELGDFADTAALIANLDLLISVDTAYAHLAGALGRPVWTLLSAIPDWRWMRDLAQSPWYPSMRLLRQARPGDWTPVVQRAAQDLAVLVAQTA